MKKALLAALVLLATPAALSAQSLGDILKKASSAVTSSSTTTSSSSTASSLLGGLVTNLLGTSKVSKSNLVGTWDYTEPAIVFESSNIAGKLAGTALEKKAEKQLSSVLTTAGFTKGKVKLTFASDGTFTAALSGRTIEGTYKVSGSTISFSKTGLSTVKANASISGSTLQLAIDADKLSTVLNAATKVASSMSSTVSTLSSLLGSSDGMQLGMKFTKE